MVNKFLRLLFLTVVLLAVASVSYAQYNFGVVWSIPENPQTAIEQLRQFKEMGISTVEIKEQPIPAIQREINKLNFRVFGNLDIQFPIAQTFAEPDSSFIREIETTVSAFMGQPSLEAIGLFEFGSIHKDKFLHAVDPFVDQLKRLSDTNIYFISSRNLPVTDKIADFFIYHQHITTENIDSFTLPDKPTIRAYRFSVSSDLKGFFKPFNRFLKAAPDQSGRTIFLDSNWLLSMAGKYSWFEEALKGLATETDAVFPVPKESLPEQNQSSLPILALLLMWGAIAALYSSSPLYRKSLFRYFTGHKFFVKDVFDRHLRSSLPATIIIFQNAVLLATGIFISFSVLFSPLGTKAFYHHFPALSILGTNPFSLFIYTFFAVLLLSYLFILWLRVFHKSVNSITQIATIYAWPLQINLIIITIAIAIFASGRADSLIASLSLTAFLIFLMSFIFTSIDAVRFLKIKPKIYFLLTSGLYLIIIGALITWASTRPLLWDIISLSLSLK